MKHTRLALLLLSTFFVAGPAVAATVTMLQFGSFETRAEAEKRLSEVSGKYKAQMGALGFSIREVTLPPGNLTVYRTQAGPVESRATAQGICAQLASSGDACYIVQSAMMGKVDRFTPSAVAAAEPTVAPALSAPVAVESPAPVVAPVAEAVAEAKQELAAIPSDTPDLTRNLSTLQEAMPTSDAPVAQAVAAPEVPMENVGLLPSEQATPIPAEAAPTAMNQALDQAVESRAATEEAVAAATAPIPVAAAKPKRSFWSRLNPFSDDEDEVAETATIAPEPPEVAVAEPAPLPPVVEEPTPAAAAIPLETAPVATLTIPPAEPVMAAPLVAPSDIVRGDSLAIASKPPVDVSPAAAPAVVAEAPKPAETAQAFDTTPVVTHQEPLPLPAPPEPLNTRDRELLIAQKVAAEQKAMQAPEPLAPTELTAPSPVSGMVNVEEATRVPVTNAAASKPPALQPDVSLRPSATDGQKSVWAQIGPFADSDQALAFWVNYRQANPDFPVVRVRTVSGYQQQISGINRSWLRVGPVSRRAFAEALCASLSKQTDLRCGLVTELGVAVPK